MLTDHVLVKRPLIKEPLVTYVILVDNLAVRVCGIAVHLEEVSAHRKKTHNRRRRGKRQKKSQVS
jgi:hypothetical protein